RGAAGGRRGPRVRAMPTAPKSRSRETGRAHQRLAERQAERRIRGYTLIGDSAPAARGAPLGHRSAYGARVCLGPVRGPQHHRVARLGVLVASLRGTAELDFLQI